MSKIKRRVNKQKLAKQKLAKQKLAEALSIQNTADKCNLIVSGASVDISADDLYVIANNYLALYTKIISLGAYPANPLNYTVH